MSSQEEIANYINNIKQYINNFNEYDNSATKKGDAFCQWCLESIFDLSTDEAIDAREMSGGYDNGIDALIISDNRLVVVQCKYDSSNDWSEITKFCYDMQRIKNGKTKGIQANDAAGRAIADIQDALNMNWDVSFYYLTSTPNY